MKYWVYLNGEVLGSYEPSELIGIPDFSKTSLVCPVDGNAGQRNWRHAGIFPEIANALEGVARGEFHRPPAASDYVIGAPEKIFRGQLSSGDVSEGAPETFGSLMPPKPEEILQGATQRIFNHVTELMKELENRREERALNQSLERRLAEVKQELLAARERIKTLEEQAALLPGFEDRERKLEEFLERARADVKFRDHRIKELNHEMEELRRIEGELGDIVPENPAPIPALSKTQPRDVTEDEGKVEHPVPMPPEEGVVSMAPVWKVALNLLSDLLKKPFRSDR